MAYRIDDVLRSRMRLRINESGSCVSWWCRESDRRQEHRVKAMKSHFGEFFSFSTSRFLLSLFQKRILMAFRTKCFRQIRIMLCVDCLHVSRHEVNSRVIKAIRRWKLFSLVVWFLNLCWNMAMRCDVTRNHISLDTYSLSVALLLLYKRNVCLYTLHLRLSSREKKWRKKLIIMTLA